jgi:hypothetical protein
MVAKYDASAGPAMWQSLAIRNSKAWRAGHGSRQASEVGAGLAHGLLPQLLE